MQALSFFCAGVPVPMGSKVAFAIPGKGGARPRAVLADSNRARLNPWRRDVQQAAHEAVAGHDGQGWHMGKPTMVDATYYFARPKSHYGTKGGVQYIKPGAPRQHTSKPDRDKLDRALNDALTGVVFNDDSQSWSGRTSKVYCNAGEMPGVQVSVTTD